MTDKDTYTHKGRTIGSTLAEAVQWAKDHREEWRDDYVYLDFGDGRPSVMVDSDIRDELAKADDDAKSETQILTEAVQQLSAAVLRMQLEISLRLEKIETVIAKDGKW